MKVGVYVALIMALALSNDLEVVVVVIGLGVIYLPNSLYLALDFSLQECFYSKTLHPASSAFTASLMTADKTRRSWAISIQIDSQFQFQRRRP